jgi:hypothetical protein|tara:strand:- start:5082 stop:5510 length:429 start_codon:yes stop_codon:yes gene_type:complete
MDNNMLGLIGVGVVAYLVLKNKEQEPAVSTPVAKPGCLDQTATNYDATATVDNQSCLYPPVVLEPVLGCMDPTALNYDDTATFDAQNCNYPIPALAGCINPLATNYNPQATVDDNSCTLAVKGCTDNNASNYNPNATIGCAI